MRIKVTWYWEVCSFHLSFLCYRLRKKVQCSEQSQMPIFSKRSDKATTASQRRSKNGESKGHSRRMHFTLGNTTVKATKAKSKSILEKIMSNIYCISRSMQCYIIAQSKSVSFENELTKLKQLTQNKNQVQAILIKCFQILLSREDAWNKWLIPLNEDILPEKNFTDNQGQYRCTAIHFNCLWTSLFPIKSGGIIQLIYLPCEPYQKYGQGF